MHHVILYVDTWIAAALAIGLLMPFTIAALAGGYILATFALERAGKTVLGIHVRHLFTRISPTKFFKDGDIDDRRFVINTIKRAIETGKLKVEGVRD